MMTTGPAAAAAEVEAEAAAEVEAEAEAEVTLSVKCKSPAAVGGGGGGEKATKRTVCWVGLSLGGGESHHKAGGTGRRKGGREKGSWEGLLSLPNPFGWSGRLGQRKPYEYGTCTCTIRTPYTYHATYISISS